MLNSTATKDIIVLYDGYQPFTSGDFNICLKDFASRIGDKGVWPVRPTVHLNVPHRTTSLWLVLRLGS